MTEIASRRYQDGISSGMDGVAAWNNSSIDWTVAGRVSSIVQNSVTAFSSEFSFTGSQSLCDSEVLSFWH